MNVIGKNRELTLEQVRNNTGEFAVTLANASMSLDQLNAGYKILMDQIAFWGDQAAALKFKPLSGDKKELENITQIISIQSERAGQYLQYITAAGGSLDVLDQSAGEQSNGSGSSLELGLPTNTILVIGGLGLAAYLITRKKRKMAKAKSNDNTLMLLLLLGGGAYLLLGKKGDESLTNEFVQDPPADPQFAWPEGAEQGVIYYEPAGQVDLPTYQDPAMTVDFPHQPEPPVYEEIQYTGEPTYYADGGLVVYTDELVHPYNR